MDPTPEQLAAIMNIDEAVAWVGMKPEVLVALRKLMGNFTLLREVVLIPVKSWEKLLAKMEETECIHFAATGEGDDEVEAYDRTASPLEMGQAGSLRRIARLRMGLAADETATGEAPSVAGGGAGVPTVEASAGAGAIVLAGQITRKVKLSNVLDQGDDTEVVPIENTRLRELLAQFKTRNDNEDIQEDEEISRDQLTALDSRVLQGSAPYADFSVWRPYGARFERTMKFVAFVVGATGEWVRKEIAGPQNHTEWLKSWRVFRIGCLVLQIVTDARLSLYRDNFARLHELYRKYWWVLALADIRMRSERMERLYRQALINEEDARVASGRASGLKGFDPSKPWDYVFKLAAGDKDFWDREVKEKVFLHASNMLEASEATDDGTGFVRILNAGQDGAGKGSGAGGSGGNGSGGGGGSPRKKRKKGGQGTPTFGGGNGGKGRGQTSKGFGKGSVKGADDKFPDGRFRRGRNGREICWPWNRPTGCAAAACTRMHVCEFCRDRGHNSMSCPSKPPGWVPPP